MTSKSINSAELDDKESRFSRSRGEHAYETLKDLIERRELKPGHRMREAELAAWLGISRTPVRDALKHLASDGLLVTGASRGLVIASLDQQQVTEIYALRYVVEGLAARLAAHHASSAEISALGDIVRQQAATPDADIPTLGRLNRQFHELIQRAARNRYLLDALDSLRSPLALLPGSTYAIRGRPAVALAEHKAILRAIAAHDGEVAERVTREHLWGAERIRLQMLVAPSINSAQGLPVPAAASTE